MWEYEITKQNGASPSGDEIILKGGGADDLYKRYSTDRYSGINPTFPRCSIN